VNIKYGFDKTVPMDFEAAIDAVTHGLQTEGFGVLSDIGVAATMKKKLGEEMPPYRILGACNPPLAHRAITSEPSIGLLLPCRVVARQEESGVVHTEFMDPDAVLDLVDSPAVCELAGEVKSRLERVMAAL